MAPERIHSFQCLQLEKGKRTLNFVTVGHGCWARFFLKFPPKKSEIIYLQLNTIGRPTSQSYLLQGNLRRNDPGRAEVILR